MNKSNVHLDFVKMYFYSWDNSVIKPLEGATTHHISVVNDKERDTEEQLVQSAVSHAQKINILSKAFILFLMFHIRVE